MRFEADVRLQFSLGDGWLVFDGTEHSIFTVLQVL